MTSQLAVNLLRQGNTGNEILNILETLVADIVEENINDCAAHYAAISTPTLEEVQF